MIRRRPTSSFIVTIALTTATADLISNTTAQAQESRIRTVALSDEPVSTDQAFGDFSAPVVNNAGQTAFRSTLRSTQPDLSVGAFLDRGGVVATLARTGGSAPGTSAFFSTVGQPVLNHSGAAALAVTLQGGDVDPTLRDNAALYAGAPGGLTLAARENGPAADLPAGTAYRPSQTGSPFDALRFNNAGQVAFTSLLTGPNVDASNGIALFAGAPGNVHVVTRAGQAAPGAGTSLPAGTVLGPSFASSAFPVLTPVFNDAGQVLFRQELRNASQSVGNGLFLGSPGDVRLIAATGSPAPDMPAGVTHGFEGFNLAVNAKGQVAFAGTLAGPVVSLENDEVIYAGAPGALHKVAQENDPAPGAGTNVRLAEFSAARKIILNNNGQVAFQTLLKGDGVNGFNNQALYTGAQDNLRLIARTGEQAPGAPAGSVYRNFFGAALNDRGEAAFVAQLGPESEVNPPDGAATGFALVGYEPSVGDRVILRQGQSIEVAPGVFRTVLSFAVNAEGSGEDGLMSGLNDAGILTFSVLFTDGNYGVFTSAVPIDSFLVPEPSSAALLVMSAGLLLKRRRRE